MFNQLGLQLWTVRDHFTTEEEANNTFKRIHDLGYTQAHTAGNYGFTFEKFGEMAKNNGVQIIGTHFDYNMIQNDPEETMRVHKLWGTTNIGIGGMDAENFTNLDKLKDFIKTYNRLGEQYAKHGFKLTYHNHHREFLRIDGTKTVMDYLYEGLDKDTVSFVLDTCWVHAGCANLNRWMEKLAGRIDILHLKDVKLQSDGKQLYGWMTEVGNGLVEWDDVLRLARLIGVKYYVVEQDHDFIDDDPFKSIQASAQFLKPLMD